MIRAAIVGCGKIADQHAAAIARLRDATVCAVCDREPLMAGQLAERLPAARAFSDLGELLAEEKPTVVHITTPPASHHPIAKQCLAAGAHVYVEKPFTVTGDEAADLTDCARTNQLKLTVGQNTQFEPAGLRTRKLLEEGALGGAPVHMECTFCYSFGDERYAKALLGDKSHWVRHLPGKLLHNIISHGIGKIAEHLDDDAPSVTVAGFTSDLLQRIGETEIVDELRTIIRCRSGMTAYFTFSSQMGPPRHEFRLFGPGGAILADHASQSVVRLANRSDKSYLRFFLPQRTLGKQYLRQSRRNMGDFLFKRLYDDAGMKCLIEAFYDSINGKRPPPIPPADIVLTARIMDDIFAQLSDSESGGAPEQTSTGDSSS